MYQQFLILKSIEVKLLVMLLLLFIFMPSCSTYQTAGSNGREDKIENISVQPGWTYQEPKDKWYSNRVNTKPDRIQKLHSFFQRHANLAFEVQSKNKGIRFLELTMLPGAKFIMY